MNTSPIISVSEAADLIQKGAILLDASIDKVNEKLDNNPIELLPNSYFFDIEGALSDHNTGLPHSMVNEQVFTAVMQEIGINQDSVVIVYDRWGLYSSPRAWWMLTYMGLEKVFVLHGGLPAWKESGRSIAHAYSKASKPGNFTAKAQQAWLTTKEAIEKLLDSNTSQILDARSEGRFDATAAEPRAGLPSGHIPGSKNLPFDKLLHGYYFKDDLELKKLFEDRIQRDKPTIFSCGSGITASILALAAYHLGHRQISVYDGSWTEWASDPKARIEK
ncbi:sulfurtransferase [Sphingobacterium sp. HJSM2_6]|uniref:sulfurtransferase n=1 Tax=Sphingobacterium sp. HJSM2_6 TaxID=3366264 RepID=UPI003BEC2972